MGPRRSPHFLGPPIGAPLRLYRPVTSSGCSYGPRLLRSEASGEGSLVGVTVASCAARRTGPAGERGRHPWFIALADGRRLSQLILSNLYISNLPLLCRYSTQLCWTTRSESLYSIPVLEQPQNDVETRYRPRVRCRFLPPLFRVNRSTPADAFPAPASPVSAPPSSSKSPASP